MKTRKILISSLSFSLLLLTSCNKAEIIPLNTLNTDKNVSTTENVENRSVLLPQIIATSYSATNAKGGVTSIKSNITQVTYNVYNSSLRLNWRVLGTTTWQTSSTNLIFNGLQSNYNLNTAYVFGTQLECYLNSGSTTSAIFQILVN